MHPLQAVILYSGGVLVFVLNYVYMEWNGHI